MYNSTDLPYGDPTGLARIIEVQDRTAEVPDAVAIDFLLTQLGAADDLLCQATAEALAGQAAYPPLREALLAQLGGGGNATGTAAAIRALQPQVGHPEVWKMLLRLLADPRTDSQVRQAGARALRPLTADPCLLAELLPLLAAPEIAVFQSVLEALADQLAHPQVRDRLIVRVDDPDRFVRQIAVQSLRRWLRDPAVRAVLRRHQDDPDRGVREVASAYLLCGVRTEDDMAGRSPRERA